MGDPKHSRKQYKNPPHPWQEDRIHMENDYLRHYGLKNKREFWKARSRLKKIRGHARNLQARLRYGDKQASKEMDSLIDKLHSNGYILGEELNLNDVLDMTIENILDRRLQTIVYHKGLAHTPKQARQLITHGHIQVKGRRTTIPSYIVSKDEETTINYYKGSPMSDELHPERPDEEKSPVPIQEQMKKEKEKNKYRRRRR
ncbi:MAG: 30S ribosomal protein S4 [Thermoplasmatota archaeon]